MSVKDVLLETLSKSQNEYISGSALAEKLNVSRNAVWKAVKALESDGYLIESVTSKGYRLSSESNRLSDKFINTKLSTKALGRNIILLKETESTNNTAKEYAGDNAIHGTTIIAETQTMGKGRLGRNFSSPASTGIYMSVIIRPTFGIETASLITSATAVAVAEATEELCSCPVMIKWVNDLYINEKKICGILTEASLGLEMKSLDYAVIGIGINVRSVKSCFDNELLKTVSSIEDEAEIAIDRNALCANILNKLEKRLDTIESRDFLSEYRQREYLTGKEITANVGGESIQGFAKGIDDNANLILEMPDSSVRYISSGEANLCRIKSQSE